MNILPVSINLPLYDKTKMYNMYNKYNMQATESNPNISNPLKPLACDTVSFKRVAQNAEPLRALMEYGIPGMYSGKVVISPNQLKELFAKNIFNKPINALVKDLAPYENSLLDVEHQFFNIIKEHTKIKGTMSITDVIKKITPEHNKKILDEQRPIFETLNHLAENLPVDKLKDYNRLMEITYKKLYREAIVLPFSAKEFQYKLKRIADEMLEKSDYDYAEIIQKMIQLAKKIPEKTPEEINDFKNITSKVIKNKKLKFNKKLTRTRADYLTQVEMIAMQTDLRNNSDLNKLLAQTRAKIYGIPIIIPFNRKSFIYELKKIIKNLDDEKLGRQMLRQATLLPTSHNNLSAFVMKCAEYSPDKIGYTMFSGSVGNIDHLVPFSKKGKDCIENYGISSSYYNSERAEKSFAQQLKTHPETYKNCQKQVDRLIELCNNGIFQKVKLPKFYIINFVTKLYNLSPEENRLIINIDKLNITNKEREQIQNSYQKSKYPFSKKFKD